MIRPGFCPAAFVDDPRRLNLSPHAYVAAAVLVVCGSYLHFRTQGGVGGAFWVPPLILAALWGVMNAWRQARGLSRFHHDRTTPWARMLRRALARYLVWGMLLLLALVFFAHHPYYRGLPHTQAFLEALWRLYLPFGLPYFLITLRLRASRAEDFHDPAVRVIHLLRATMGRGRVDRRRAWRAPGNRKVLLNLLLRAYFIPVMVGQVAVNLDQAIALEASWGTQGHLALLFWFSSLLWAADAIAASAAYGLESRWMENRSRSVDRTLSGWLVCLACYAPANQVTALIFPFGPNVAAQAPESLLLAGPEWILGYKLLETALLTGLIYSDLSLGPSGANLTFKRLQWRGPYALVRHPATSCKLSFWWLQSLVYGAFWSPMWLLGMAGWSGLYIARCLTEERHLSQYGEYRWYMARVRHRFIPGII